MSLNGAEFYIEVHGIVADRGVLGQSVKVLRQSERLRIDFPEGPESFHFMQAGQGGAQSGSPDPRDYSPSRAMLDAGRSFVEIRLVRVLVNQEAPLSLDTWDPDDAADAAQYRNVFFWHETEGHAVGR